MKHWIHTLLIAAMVLLQVVSHCEALTTDLSCCCRANGEIHVVGADAEKPACCHAPQRPDLSLSQAFTDFGPVAVAPSSATIHPILTHDFTFVHSGVWSDRDRSKTYLMLRRLLN